MALTHGPRLGAPATDGFKVWCRFDGAATIKLQTRLTGASTWTLQDTQAVETSKDNTVVVTATGLSARTKYDYRILEDDVEVATNTTWTMPSSGQFVAYVISDLHGSPTDPNTAIEWAKDDFEANYEPSSVPAVIFCIGDLFAIVDGDTLSTARTKVQTMLARFGTGPERIPFCYIADDWDYGGNNSAGDITGFTTNSDADVLQDEYWRERPQPAAPSFGSLYTICDVPFIVADQRSQKWSNRSGLIGDAIPGGNYAPRFTKEEFPKDTRATIFGTAQRDWIIDTLKQNASKSLVVMVSTTTFTDPSGFPGADGTNAGCRDGINCYYVGERNYILEKGCVNSGYAWRNNLVIWSGDDHFCCVWDHSPRLSSTVTGFNMYSDPGLPIGLTGPMPGGLKFREFKTRSVSAQGDLGAVIHAEGAPGVVWVPDIVESPEAVLRWDITSRNIGENVTARVTFWDVTTNLVILSENAVAGDFYFENGHWEAYDADAATNFTVMQAQMDPNNGMGGVSFNRWYEDTINGTLHSETQVRRDTRDRLRNINDMGDLDRDDILESWDPRTEEGYPDP